jgi:hypothetical protein
VPRERSSATAGLRTTHSCHGPRHSCCSTPVLLMPPVPGMPPPPPAEAARGGASGEVMRTKVCSVGVCRCESVYCGVEKELNTSCLCAAREKEGKG